MFQGGDDDEEFERPGIEATPDMPEEALPMDNPEFEEEEASGEKTEPETETLV